MDEMWESANTKLHGFQVMHGEKVTIDGIEYNALKKIDELNLTSAKAAVAALLELSRLKYAEAGIEIWLRRLRRAYSAKEIEILTGRVEGNNQMHHAELRVGESSFDTVAKDSRKKMLGMRPKSTSLRYKGPAKEFQDFCAAEPGAVLNKVRLPDNKIVVNDTVTIKKVLSFFEHYYTLRPRLGASIASGKTLSYPSLKSAVSALVDMQHDQRTRGTPQQMEELRTEPGLRSKGSGVSSLLARANRDHHEAHVRAYHDKASGTEQVFGLSEDQKQQLAEFGVKMGAPRHQKNWLTVGSRFHLTHILGMSTAVRGDTMRKASLSDFHLHWMPEGEGPMACPVLLFVHNNDKNSDGFRDHNSAAIRHRDCPLRCLLFALAYYIFITYILEQVIPYPDVMPRQRGYNPEPDSGSDEDSSDESSSCKAAHKRAGVVADSKEMAEHVIRPWYREKLIHGHDKVGRGRAGRPNPRKQINHQTLLAEHKHAHENIRDSFRHRHVVHFARGEALRSSIAAGVSRQQVGLAGCYHDNGTLDVHYLSRSVAMEFVREKAKFPLRKGCFKVDRMITPVDPDFANQIFRPIYEGLEGFITERDNSGKSAEVHKSDRGLVRLMKYLGVVLVQDLAFLVNRGDFKDHPILGHEYFRDDAHGFKTFCKKQEEDITKARNTPEGWMEKIRETLITAGEKDLAQSMQSLFDNFLARTLEKSLATQQTPQQSPQQAPPEQAPSVGPVVEDRRNVLVADQTDSSTPCDNLSPLVTRIESPPLASQPRVLASDVATWPKPPESYELPEFARFIQFGSDVKTVQDVADEYYRKFGENAGIREVERFYGPKVRTGSKAKGISYRASAHYPGGSQRFARRNLIYRILEEKGEVDGVRELQARICQHFPGEQPHWLHIKWLQDQLNHDNAKRDPTRSDRVRTTKAAKRRRLADAALGAATASVDTSNDAAANDAPYDARNDLTNNATKHG